MTTHTLESALRDLLCGEHLEDTALGGPVLDLCNFDEIGYLTYDRGLVFRTEDGSEFQLTIKQVN